MQYEYGKLYANASGQVMYWLGGIVFGVIGSVYKYSLKNGEQVRPIADMSEFANG